MIRSWAFIIEAWWYSSHRSSTDSMYACLIWNATFSSDWCMPPWGTCKKV